MLWLTWRQYRMQVVVTAVLVAGVGVLLAMDSLPLDFVKALPWIPVLVGWFWGVPLLTREFERGTHRLAWTQSVTRRRWLVAKLGWLGLAVTLAGLAVGLAVTYWTTTYGADRWLNRFSGDLFGVTGIAPAGWFLLVFALGAASGAVLRRTLPAMAVTIAVFAALVVSAFLGRGHYADPEVALSDPHGRIDVPADALVVDTGVRGPAGDDISWSAATSLCAGTDAVACMRDRGYVRQYTSYQPASRYWRFQWTEVGLLVLLSVGLLGFTARRVLRGPV
jgi:hypothetical protein